MLKKKIIVLVLVFTCSFLSACASNNTKVLPTATTAVQNNNSSSNNKVNVTIGNNTTTSSTTPVIKNVPPANLPPVSSSTAGSKNTVNGISTTQLTTIPQVAAVNVADDASFRKALIDSLSQGQDFALNLQGKFTKDNIAREAMKVIETSGYSGYISGIQYIVSNNVAYISFQYKVNSADFLTKSNAVDAKVKEIIATQTNSNMSDYDKELALHDYLVNNCSYDYNNLLKGTLPDDSFTAYGALINGVAVCEGYAESMFKLLTAANVQSYLINGYGNGVAHEWNLVKIQGGLYHLDATYDDPISTTPILSHNYFNVNDAEISKDHTWGNLDYPVSVAVAANYFVVNNLSATNKSKYYDIVKNGLMKKSPVIYVRTSTYDTSSYTSDVILKILKDNTSIDYVDTTVGYSFSYDPASCVIEFIINYK